MKQIKSIITAILLISTLLCFCACGESGGTESSQTESTASVAESSVAESAVESETASEPANEATFKVNVVDADGNPVSGVMLQVCKDTCIPAKTDESGVATFSIEITDGYKLSVLTCPEGYTYTGEAEVYLESGISEYTVELVKGN